MLLALFDIVRPGVSSGEAALDPTKKVVIARPNGATELTAHA